MTSCKRLSLSSQLVWRLTLRSYLQEILSTSDEQLFLHIYSNGSAISRTLSPLITVKQNQRRSISKSEPIPENTIRAVPFIVDHGLCDLLFDHQIEGRRVLPGASLADFFATHTPSRSLKIITFHAPVIIRSRQNGIFGNFDAHGSFSMVQGSTKVCSGIIAPESNFVMTNLHTNQPPECVRSKDEVWFKSVQFGPSFRNVQEIRTWPWNREVYLS